MYGFAHGGREACRGFVYVLLVAGLVAGGPRAATTRSWSASSGEEFSRGVLEGTAVDEEGQLRLARNVETLWGPDEGVVWDLGPTEQGGTFVALSSPGRVLLVGDDGETEVWYEAESENLIAAVTPDSDGGVYVGLSPGGQLLHLRGPGESELLLETDAVFIWALAGGADGSLWIGTGIPGKLLRRTSGGRLETVFEAGSDPVRCLAPLEDGGIVVGTGGRGRVIRFDGDGDPFVVFDAEEPEIVDLVATEDGTLYVLAAQGSAPVRAARPSAAAAHPANETVRVTAGPPPENGEEQNGKERKDASEKKATARRPGIPRGAALYRLSADGAARKIWTTAREMPFAMTRTADGELLVATGDQGRVYRLDRHGRASMQLQIPSDQASALASFPDGRVLVGGTSDARLTRLGAAALEIGTYLSEAVDAGTAAEWGRVSWDGEFPRGSGITLHARGGNTDSPDSTWSDWVELTDDGEYGADSPLPLTRWFQARVQLRASRSGDSPALRRLEVFFLPRNRSPQIETFEVLPAGIVWSQSTAQSTRPRGPIVADDPVSRKAVQELRGRVARTVRKSFELGARTASWKVSDADGDRIRHTVEIRREGDPAWLPLAVGVHENYIGWDARGLPDGLYRLRLTSTDALDNPGEKQFSDRMTSSVFQIDNTRPSIASSQVREQDDGYDVEFVAADPGGHVAAVEVAVDGGDWQPVDPLDGVADSSEERYQVRVDPGETELSQRSIHVRVTDSSGNLGGDAWPLEED